ncbi:hypothetical protein BPAE_0084g00280 [Botrytis paeoniae]|uniref:Uncharacterized protein n=1 Tax=Botrytis paeoniae TaxID=278948 RepID=A0A4Z1FUC9_9HELO|nr:hypothetical protein BPAE_0084g00280 [Botrytis paeoniae]
MEDIPMERNYVLVATDLDYMLCIAAWGLGGEIGQAVVELCEWGFLIQVKKTQEADGLNLKLIMENSH